ncbi:MAG TPA: phosphoglycerate kinase, partial [Candidatus Dormibacteraeota bacterium]|nr:phosphoglycerate kinase [Candidatus Dormibacteraeota bacterium]
MKASYELPDVRGLRVLLREDLNVPLKEGSIGDETRLRAALPTIRSLSQRGAKTVVMSHLGRPKGKPDASFTLRPVAGRLSELLGTKVAFVEHCTGAEAEAAVEALAPGEVILLENVRFHPEEEANDADFARRLAALGDLYVNDAFAASHRAHASVVGIADHLPAYAGSLMLTELEALHRALDDPRHPVVAIVGGAKISTKTGVLRNLLPKVDSLIIGGAMANTFFKAKGYEVGASLVEDASLDEARRVEADAAGKLLLPVDAVCARAVAPDQEVRIMPVDQIEPGWIILDIGPESIRQFAAVIASAATLVWNGPVGVFEIPEFATGTRALGEAA